MIEFLSRDIVEREFSFPDLQKKIYECFGILTIYILILIQSHKPYSILLSHLYISSILSHNLIHMMMCIFCSPLHMRNGRYDQIKKTQAIEECYVNFKFDVFFFKKTIILDVNQNAI
jgi:hypothetical protein